MAYTKNQKCGWGI